MSQAGKLAEGSPTIPGIETLTGNTGGAVPGSGVPVNVNVVGGTGVTVAGDPGTSTLTINLTGGGIAIDSLIPNSGTSPVVPDGTGAVTLQGTGSITTVGGLNSLTPQLTGLTNHNVLVGAGTATITNVPPSTSGFVLTSNGAAADPSFQAVSASGAITTITGNSGGAESPLAGNFNIVGTGSITVAGSANTETVQLTGLTNHSLQVGAGTATLTQLGVATNGQLPIGSTGADPVLAAITAGTNISVTNGAGSITIAANTQSQVLNITSVTTTPYVVLSTDYFLAVSTSGGAKTIQLPNAPSTGRVFVVKDSTGTAATNNITVTTVGGAVTIDGATSYIINTAYSSIELIFDGTSYEVF